MTKRRDVVRKLERAGFTNIGGARHDVFVHPDGRTTAVPRHRELKDLMAQQIYKEAGLR